MPIKFGHDPYGLLGLPQEQPMGQREEMFLEDALKRRRDFEQFGYGLYDTNLRASAQMQIADQRDSRMVQMQGAQQQFQAQQNERDFQQQQQILQQQGQQQQQNFDHQFTAKQQADLAQWSNNKNALEAQIAQYDNQLQQARDPQQQALIMKRIEERMTALDMVNAKLGAIKPVPIPKPPPPNLQQESQDNIMFSGPDGNVVQGLPPQGYSGPVWKRNRNGVWDMEEIKSQKDLVQEQQWKIEAQQAKTYGDWQLSKAKYRSELLKLSKPTKKTGPDGAKATVPMYSPEEIEAKVNQAFPEGQVPMPGQNRPPEPGMNPLGAPTQTESPWGNPGPAPAGEPPLPPTAQQQQPDPIESNPDLKPLKDAMRRERESGGKQTDGYLATFRQTVQTPMLLPPKGSEAKLKDGGVYIIKGSPHVYFSLGGQSRFVPL